MHKASLVNAAGADFWLMGVNNTSIKTTKPLISICAVRTGCGKSQTTRAVINALKAKGRKVVSIRHPMPYGDLVAQRVQRFAELSDLKKHKCTIEEMEEYEPHIQMKSVIYAGVDYEAILREAEKEADVIIWDGGNNDTPFYTSDKQLSIVVVDPHRPGDEVSYYPGETNMHLADVIVINKIDSADLMDINEVRENIREINPKAKVVDAASPLSVDKPELITGKRVLIVEDGPPLPMETWLMVRELSPPANMVLQSISIPVLGLWVRLRRPLKSIPILVSCCQLWAMVISRSKTLKPPSTLQSVMQW